MEKKKIFIFIVYTIPEKKLLKYFYIKRNDSARKVTLDTKLTAHIFTNFGSMSKDNHLKL